MRLLNHFLELSGYFCLVCVYSHDFFFRSLDFLDLYNKIGTAEDNLRRTTHDLLRYYYNFGQAIKQFDYFRKTCNEDVSNAKINDRIMKQISVQDKLTETNLRKRKERSKRFSGSLVMLVV